MAHAVDAEKALQAAETSEPQNSKYYPVTEIGERAAVGNAPLGDWPAKLHANLEHAALQRRRVANAIIDVLLHLLPDTWHAQKALRGDLAQIDHDGVDGLREAHDAAGEQLHDGRETTLSHVAERQIAEHRIVLRVQAEDGNDLHRGMHHVAMVEHRAF